MPNDEQEQEIDQQSSQPWRSKRIKKIPSRYNSVSEGSDVKKPGVCDGTSCTTVSSADNKIHCDRCSSLYCYVCISMSIEDIDKIKSCKGNLWFCVNCLNPAINAVTADKEIEEKCNEYLKTVHDRIVQIEQKIERLQSDKANLEVILSTEAELNKKLKEQSGRIETLENNLQKHIQPSEKNEMAQEEINVPSSETITRITSAVNENLNREKNILIFNLEENTKQSDNATVCKLLSFLSGRSMSHSNKRLGKPSIDENSTNKQKPNPRPLMITFSDKTDKLNIMTSLKALGNDDCPSEFKNISVKYDMTPEEREHEKSLRKEASAKNLIENTPAKNYRYVVRGPPWNLRIISRQKPPIETEG